MGWHMYRVVHMSLKPRGIYLWWWQRSTAFIMCGMVVIIIGCSCYSQDRDILRYMIFSSPYAWYMALSFLMMYGHALIGGYVVVTDYVHDFSLRLIIGACSVIYGLMAVCGLGLWLW